VLPVLDGLFRVARGWQEGALEGPGALVPEPVWLREVRRLARTLLCLEPGQEPDLTGTSAEQRATADVVLAAETPVASTVVPVAAPQLLAVVGCGRSGTTWLEAMLMSSPDAGGVDGAESFLFEQISPLWDQRAALAPLVTEARLVAALRAFCDAVLGHALALSTPGAGTFVEKTPLHSWHLTMMARLYPEASFVHLVRDGRDVARSISQVDFFLLADPADAARQWRLVVEGVRAQAPEVPRYREVRYEQLLADPVGEVTSLLAWAGLDTTAGTLTELERRVGTRVSKHAGTASALGSRTWEALPPRDLAAVYAECGPLLVREGYATVTDLVRARLHPSYWRRRLQARSRP
jgi:hypothetical protein